MQHPSELQASSPEHRHDPGGKVRKHLPDGVLGRAEFSDCGLYRPVLWRELGTPSGNYALWVAMNPSTASATVDDSTIAREWYFTAREGYQRMAKTNVMDYRATKPRDLRVTGVAPRSAANLPTIQALASQASIVILAFGALHPRLAHYGQDVVNLMREMGITPWCLGLTKKGAPRHPLYLRKDTLLRPYQL